MKKNKALRAAAALGVLAMLSTSVISGTFAKYVTKDKAGDTARVAKWGVEVAVGGSLFSDTYKDTAVTGTTYTVKAASNADKTTDDIVAPGTTNDMGMEITLKGTPEVSTKITMSVTADDIVLKAGTYGIVHELPTIVNSADFAALKVQRGKLYSFSDSKYSEYSTFNSGTKAYYITDSVTLSADYYPVQYSIGTATGKTADAAAKLLLENVLGIGDTDITTKNNTHSSTVTKDANTNLATLLSGGTGTGTNTIKWQWPFETGSSDNEKTMYNTADTILGQLQAGASNVVVAADSKYSSITTDSYNLSTGIDVAITVEQVD